MKIEINQFSSGFHLDTCIVLSMCCIPVISPPPCSFCCCCFVSLSHLSFSCFVTDPPNITYISGNLTVNQTDQVNPVCNADGNPAPSIAWTRVSNNSAVTFPLTITGKLDEGAYRCTATNGFGNYLSSRNVFVIVQSKFLVFSQAINYLSTSRRWFSLQKTLGLFITFSALCVCFFA